MTIAQECAPVYFIPLASYLMTHVPDLEVSIKDYGDSRFEEAIEGKFSSDLRELDAELDAFFQLLDGGDYDAVGISCYTTAEYVSAVLLGTAARAVLPDTPVFTETTPQMEIVNRKSIVVGPHTADQTAVNVQFDGTTGLHEITGTLAGLSMFATTVRVVCRDRANKRTYVSFDVTGSGVSRSYSMKIPANLAVLLELESYLFGSIPGPMTKPSESQTFTVTAGAPDNATVPTVDLTYNMATVTGTFSNYGASTAFPLIMRFGDVDVVGFGTTMLGYSVRVPTGVTGRIGVQGQTAGGLMERGMEMGFGPFNVNSILNFDLASASPNQTDITTNIPTGIGTHGASVILLGIHPNEDVVWFPFTATGTVGASSITASMRHYPKSASRWVLMVGDDDAGSNASSGRFVGNITDPVSFLGTSQNITLLNVPDMTAPANGATLPAQVNFTWNLDGTLSGNGFSIIDIRDALTGDTVWTLIIEGSLSSVTLPILPGSVSGFELQTGTQYDWDADALTLTNFDFNNFQIDTLKGMRTLIESGQEVRIAETDSFQFTVN